MPGKKMAAGVLLAASYGFLVRPWMRSWGSTAAEAGRPEDSAGWISIRAVTIEAGTDQVREWLERIAGREGELETGREPVIRDWPLEKLRTSFAIEPLGSERCRLVARVSGSRPSWWLLRETVEFLKVRRLLLELRDHADYYRRREPWLRLGLKVLFGRLRPTLETRYGSGVTEQILERTREEFSGLVGTLPYVGGARNHFTPIVVATGVMVAFHRALEERGESVETTGAILREWVDTQWTVVPGPVRRLLGGLACSAPARRQLREHAAWSQERRYPDDWVFTFEEGHGRGFDWGVEYSECAVCKLMERLEARELLPYCSLFDICASRALGLGMQLEDTLGAGGKACRARMRHGLATEIPDHLPEALQD